MDLNKLLITGASGLIGTAVIKAALRESKWEIYAVSSGRTEVHFAEGVHHIKANLLDHGLREKLIEEVRPDIMLHLAWSLEDSAFKNSYSNILWLEASLHLLRLFHDCDGSYFVFAGSSSEYGTWVCKENSRTEPTNLYGKCKGAFTNIANAYCEQSNIKFASVRYFPIYGENDVVSKGAIPYAIGRFIKGERVYCKAPNNVWDFVYVGDAAEATVKIINSEYSGIVNVASGRPCIMKDVFSNIAEELNCIQLLEIDESNSFNQMLIADTTILNDVIGFACKTSLSDGLRKTIAWWKERA